MPGMSIPGMSMPGMFFPGDPAVLVASSKRIIEELGWKPRYSSLDEIVRSAWVWHQQRYGAKGLSPAEPAGRLDAALN